MFWLSLVVVVYLVGLSVAFRKTLRSFLTRWEKLTYWTKEYSFFGGAGPYIRAAICAIFWPVTLASLLLVMGVKSEQQEEKERKAAEAQKRKDYEDFKRKAQDMNIPGWDQLP